MFNNKKMRELKESIRGLNSIVNQYAVDIGDLKNGEQQIYSLIDEIKKNISDKGNVLSETNKIIDGLKLSTQALSELLDSKFCQLNSRINEISQSTSDNLNKLIQQIPLCNKRIDDLSKQTGGRFDLLHNELKTIKENFENTILDVENNFNDAIGKVKEKQIKYEDDAKQTQSKIAQNVSLIKNNTQDITTIRQSLEKGLLDTEHKARIYIDNHINKLKEEILSINGRITSANNIISQQDIKIKFTEDTINELKESNKDLLQKITSLKGSEDRLISKINILSDAIANKIDIAIDKKSAEYQRFINQEYYEAIVKILSFNKKMLCKVNPKINDDEIDKLKFQLEQKALEEKWIKEKQEQGHNIVNKGVLVIDRRKQLHDELLLKEKQGEDVSKLKERLKAFDEILEMIKCEK